ncbi:MAG: hypothetical protein ACE14P_14860 [Methanotrichaceae archaeon]
MRRGSFKSRLPRGRHRRSRYNNYIAPALVGLAFLSVIIASSFFLHILPWPSGLSIANSSSNFGQRDTGVLKVAAVDSDLIATVSVSQSEALTKVQVENAGSSQFRDVKVMADGGKVLGILSQLAPDEKKILATKGDLKDVKVSAIDPSDREVSGDVHYVEQSDNVKQPEPQKALALSGGAPLSSGSPEAHLSIQTVEEPHKPVQSDLTRQDTRPRPNDTLSNFNKTLPMFNISIITNRSSGYQGDVVEYYCRAVNSYNDSLSEVRLYCAGQMMSTIYLTPGKEISLKGILVINDSMNISAGVQGKDINGMLWVGNATAKIWMMSPLLRVNVTVPDKIHRGQSIGLAVDVANIGRDRLTNLSISDSFGEFGRIPALLPGESQRLQRNASPDKSIQYKVEAIGQDSSGMDAYASKRIDLNVFTSGLDISADQPEVTGYSNQPVNIIWTLKNTGEERLKNITLGGDGKRCRLDELLPGGSTKIEGVYVKENTSPVNVTAEGYDPQGYLVSSMGSVLIRTILPGISLNVMPPEIEASKGQIMNVSCLITNTGDDPLTDVVLLEGSRVIATMDNLNPGEFRVTPLQFAVGTNTTFEFRAEGKDSNGRTWSDSAPFRATIVASGIKASASATVSGETASITCKVTNFGSAALYNTFVLSKTFGPLGTIDYIPPKGQRYVNADRQICSDVDDSISIEAFTFEKQPVHTSCKLSISMPKNPVPGSIQSIGARRVLPDLDQGNIDHPGHISATDIPERSSIKSALNSTVANSGNDLLNGIEGMIRYIQRMLGRAGADVSPNYNSINAYNKTNYDSSYDSSSELSSPSEGREDTKVSKDYELSIASVRGSEHGAISILDISAVPSQPAAGQPVKVSVHAKSANSIRSAKAKWGLSDMPLTKQDMMDVDRIHSMPMMLESGDSRDGYWSCTVPGRTAGTYMVLSVALTDGSTSAEDGPYMLHWSTVKSNQMPAQARAIASSGKGMLFIESTVVNGKGEVSIKDNIQDSAVNYNERMKGNGSINLESERRIDKSRPGTNFTDRKDLVFTGGILKGQKSLASPAFDGGMGASITERFNLSHVDKSETNMVRNANYTYNTLAFSTDQAFDGNWNIQTQYAQFYRKMKADQQYTGSFQTQKKIEFDDRRQ